MMSYTPVLGRPRLGQSLDSLLTGGLTKQFADQIVAAAEPPTRAIVRDERNRLAEGLIGGIPYAALSGVTFVATKYLVPEKNLWKFTGYAASLLTLGIGAWFTFSRITEVVPPSPPSGPMSPVAVQFAQAIVTSADPKIREIVDEERTRITQAAQAGLPYLAAGALALVSSAGLISADEAILKFAAFAGSIGLMAIGAYVAFEKEAAA